MGLAVEKYILPTTSHADATAERNRIPHGDRGVVITPIAEQR